MLGMAPSGVYIQDRLQTVPAGVYIEILKMAPSGLYVQHHDFADSALWGVH